MKITLKWYEYFDNRFDRFILRNSKNNFSKTVGQDLKIVTTNGISKYIYFCLNKRMKKWYK